MTVELGKAKPNPIDFTLNGKELAARKIPFRLAVSLYSGEEKQTISADVMADIIQACVVYPDGTPAFETAEEVLEWDFDQMTNLFAAVSGAKATPDKARKNSKASR